MSRLVLPNLFEVWGARVVVGGVERQGLRWMLAETLGLPTVAFQVWAWIGNLPGRELALTTHAALPGDRVLDWPGGAVIGLQLTVDVPAGQTAVLRAMTGPNGSGQVADLEAVPGPVTGRSVLLSGSAIASVTVSGPATVVGTTPALPVAAVLDGTSWQLLDRVGLPADSRFTATYSLDPQGRPGADQAPPDAAVERVEGGLPDTGWALTTDLGTAAPAFEKPDASALVTQDLAALLDAVAALLSTQPDAAKQGETWVEVAMSAPESIHGVDGSAHWQAGAAGRIRPLGSLRLAAATDPAAALALGFGTTVERRAVPQQQPDVLMAAAGGIALFMVTVAHKVVIADIPVIGELVLEGDLTGFHLDLPADPVDVPDGLAAARTGLDRPAAVDAPWLEIAEVSWAAPPQVAAQRLAPVTHAVLRADGAGAPSPVLEKRQAGGFEPFAAALDPDAEPSARVSFDDRGVPEAFPGDDPHVVYSVAAQDWFGRWSGWRSTGYTRGAVAPQVPAVANVVVRPAAGGGPGPATASVEVTWDWSNRTPASIHVRARVSPSPASPAPGTGSVLQVGGPEVPDHVVDFSAAGIDTPPPGVTEVVERRSGALRTYAITVPGLVIDHALADSIDVAMFASAIERVRPAVRGAYSQPVSTTIVTPAPPPPPFVPAAMVWASLPDPAGVSRVTLTWTGSAPSYVIYAADETAIARELGLPSPDLDVPAAERLVAWRGADLASARRAFRRVASAVTGHAHAVELPRGSRLIVFHAVVGVSAAGVESAFPTASNDFLAVASPTLAQPATPVLTARGSAAGVELAIEVSVRDVPVERVEVHRVVGRLRSGTLEAAGPPALILPASAGTRSGDVVRWSVTDAAALPPWRTLCYRAVAWAAGDLIGGIVAGRSEPTAVAEAVVASASAPDVSELRVDDVGEPGLLLASAAMAAPRERTARGAHQVAATVLGPGAAVTVHRGEADQIPLVVGPLPAADGPALFFHHPSDPAQARLSMRVPDDTVALTLEVADPTRRATRLSKSPPWSAP